MSLIFIDSLVTSVLCTVKPVLRGHLCDKEKVSL